MTNFNSLKNSFLIGLPFCMLLSACSKKIDNAYLNPNALTVQPIEQLLPNVIASFVAGSSSQVSGNGVGGDALHISRYVQYWAQNANLNQYDQMGGTTGSNGGTLGYVWTMHYVASGPNINQIVNWGIQQKKWDYVGVALAIRAWSWLTLSDEYGNIILKEAFTNRTIYDYDTLQSEAYDTVRATAYRALSYLNMTGDSVSQANLAKGDAYFYNGDVSKWKKFVYGVLARSYNHLTNHADYQPDSVIKYCNLSLAMNTDNGMVKFANTGVSGTMNYFGPKRSNGLGAVRPTAFVANLLSGAGTAFPGVVDPRIYYLIRENANGTFKGIRPNYGAQTSSGLSTSDYPISFWGGLYTTTTATNDTACRYIFTNSAPFPIMTASEIQFILAEAAYRKGDKSTALTAYKNGISLDIDMLSSTYPSNIPAVGVITSNSKAAYLSNTLIVPTDPNKLTLSQIMLQKYIALYGWGAHETWVDMRRYHYVDVDATTGSQVYTDWVPLSPADIWPANGQKYIYRCRPQNTSEYSYNILAVTAMGGTATDYCTQECWFSRKK